MTPQRKKKKYNSKSSENKSTTLKKKDEDEKLEKTVLGEEDQLKALKRNNFVKACELTSYKEYYDYGKRLGLLYIPSCAKGSCSNDQDQDNGLCAKTLPPHAEETFKIEMRTFMWYEALEVCLSNINKTQYLSANVLKDIAEIILNVHDDDFADYPATVIIKKSQQVLNENFNLHPPCTDKKLRECYQNFLLAPMALKENTFTNRTEFNCNEGLVKYCFNRLEYELSMESKDGPLVNKHEHIPEDMKRSVKGLYWQKEKFELFELLNRSERINRLMVILEKIVELLKLDLAFWFSRYTTNLSSHVMRSHRPLMATILWSNNVLFTGGVNSNCRQILKIFMCLVHLQYPQYCIDIMTNWINLTVQTFFICETNSNSDYPNIGKYSITFAREFYNIFSVLPQASILRIIKTIQPMFMQYLVGNLHINKLLQNEEECLLTNLIAFLKESHWKKYPIINDSLELSKKEHRRKTPNKRSSLLSVLDVSSLSLCKHTEAPMTEQTSNNFEYNGYPKYNPELVVKEEINLNHILDIFYLTLEAYLEAYNVQNVQDTLDRLNESLLLPNDMEMPTNELSLKSYSVTEQFIKKYRSIYRLFKELILMLQDMKNNDDVPHILKLFGDVYI